MRPTGLDPQGPPFESLDEASVVALPSFNDNRFIFEEVETIADGIGPTYNAQSCRKCHQNVVTGGASQVEEHRTGRLLDGQFFESLGGALVHSRATHPDMIEAVAVRDEVRTFVAHTASLMRTAPLWGLRTRNRLMHDGLSFTLEDAIARHRGQAGGVRENYEALAPSDKRTLMAFLNSL